jgi:peptidyl-prolyl cis-trans isomerase SurA
MRSRFLLVALVALVALLPATSARGELVDRIVAIIDREVVTLSEAEQARSIGKARSGAEAPLADVVERLIESRLVEREVERFTGEPVAPDVVDAALREVRGGFSSEPAFQAMLAAVGLTEEALRAELGRQVAVSQYLERRFRPLTFVTDEQIEVYYRDELLPEVRGQRTPELSDVSDAIRRILEERAFNARVEEWIEALKGRARIRRYVW